MLLDPSDAADASADVDTRSGGAERRVSASANGGGALPDEEHEGVTRELAQVVAESVNEVPIDRVAQGLADMVLALELGPPLGPVSPVQRLVGELVGHGANLDAPVAPDERAVTRCCRLLGGESGV